MQFIVPERDVNVKNKKETLYPPADEPLPMPPTPRKLPQSRGILRAY
jgi:hypothetical protein